MSSTRDLAEVHVLQTTDKGGQLSMTALVSVIIPVYNDATRIQLALRAVLAQTYPPESIEIIVVDNGSTDATQEAVQQLQDMHPLGRIQLLVEDQVQSSYAARNKGISHACGEIIAFTDADCQPAPDWLENGIGALWGKEAALVAGHIRMVFETGRPNIVEYADACRYLDQKHCVEEDSYGLTANLVLRRELFDRYGLFRRDLQSWGDFEFGRRVTGAGEKLVYAADAVVLHPARSTLRAYLVKEKRVGLGHRRLMELGVVDGSGVTWRSFVPWARFRRVEGVRLGPCDTARVRALLVCTKYLRLAYKLMPSAFIGREQSARRRLS